MARQMLWRRFWTYFAECARILYWTYFKPYTFNTWLQDIHPELKIYSNPWALREEFRNNPRLRRYAEQSWWLIALVPLLIVLLVALTYSLFAEEVFDFFRSSLFFLGWWAGLKLARNDFGQLRKWFYRFIWILIGSSLLFNIGFRFAPEVVQSFIQANVLSQFYTLETLVAVGVVFGVAVSMAIGVVVSAAFGVALGVAVGVAFSVAFGLTGSVAVSVAFGLAGGAAVSVAFGLTGSVAVSVAFGLAGGAAFGLAVGVAVGLVGGVTEGVAFGLVRGLAGGVAFVLGVFRVYFWLPELLWVLLLFLFTRVERPATLLCYLPPRFDEFIILPLPFMSHLIVAAYSDNPAAAQNTIYYLINSTNQQRVAARAITGITANLLSQCQTPQDIAAILDQLDWIPSPPPAQLGQILPQLREIARDVRAAEEATSVYNQANSIAAPIRKLKALRQNLAFEKNPHLATAFGSIAERWLRILETAQRTLNEQAQQSGQIPQVYIAGPALDPDRAKTRFKGRRDLFGRIETLVLSDQPPILLLYGGRRTGKTSSLKYLPEKVGSDIVPLFVDVQGIVDASTLPGLAKSFVSALRDSAHKARRLSLPPLETSEIEKDPFPALRDWFGRIENAVPGKRFLLCLDEFERLSEIINSTGSRAPLNFLRNILQHRQRWIVLFSGARHPNELDDYWSDYLINTRALRISYLDEASARELICCPVPDFPPIYDDAAVDAILAVTRGQPYFIQLLCSVIVEQLNREERRTATIEDVESSIPKVLETAWGIFDEFWRNLTERQKDVLLRLIAGEMSIGSDRATVRQLIDKEVLELQGETYQFQVPLVQRFVAQKAMEV